MNITYLEINNASRRDMPAGMRRYFAIRGRTNAVLLDRVTLKRHRMTLVELEQLKPQEVDDVEPGRLARMLRARFRLLRSCGASVTRGKRARSTRRDVNRICAHLQPGSEIRI